MALVFFIALLLTVAQGETMPRLMHYRHYLSNNSYIYSRDIHNRDGNDGGALNCVSGGQNPSLGSWIDPDGGPVPIGCLFSKKNEGVGVIGLYRVRLCTENIEQGLWSCVAPDSSDEMRTLYVYIGSEIWSNPPGQLLLTDKPHFTLHTEPNASVPEFTISCRTHGGPATTVQWTVNDTKLPNNHSSSFINDTLTSTYDHMLRMSGRENIGKYNCSIWNNIRYYLPNTYPQVNDSIYVTVAGKPTNLVAIISESNSTHVDITVSWESPGDPVTDGYVIYYQPKGGAVSSVEVPKSKTKQELIDLPRSDSYHISIVGLLTDNLPSPLVEAELLDRSSREALTQNAPPKLIRDDSTTNIEHDVSVKYHTSSHSCQDKEDGDSTAVIAGCVGGVMLLIVVTQSLAIILLLLRQRAISNRARVSGKKLGTCGKSTIGVDPEHEMMGLQKVGAQQ